MENINSLGAALSHLRERGYNADLNFETDSFSLYGGDLDMRLNPEGFHVDEIDRIGDDAHSNDSAIVYAISAGSGIKGVIIDKSGETDGEEQSSLNGESYTA